MFPLQGGKPATATTYVDDVFSAYTYTGNGSTQTINNGIGMSSTASFQSLSVQSSIFWTEIDGIVVNSSGDYFISGKIKAARLFVARINSTGIVQWQREITTETGDANGIALDSSNNVFVGGSVGGELFLGKWNSSGILQWQKKVTNTSSLQAIAVDSSGNVYGCGTINNGGTRFFVAKWNTSGTLQWQREINNVNNSTGEGIAVDPSGNVYAVGSTSDAIPISNITTVKFNTSGVLQWQRHAKQSSSYASKVTLDSSGNVYVVGSATSGNSYVTLIKYDTSGTYQWAIRLPNNSIASKVAVDTSGNVYLLATVYDGSAEYLGFIAKFNSSGAAQWQRRLTSSPYGSLNVGAICTDSTSVYISYGTSGNVTYNILGLNQDGSATSGTVGTAIMTVSLESITTNSSLTISSAAVSDITGTAVESASTYPEIASLCSFFMNTQAAVTSQGGMVWLKGRSGATDHALYDTTRGATFDLVSNSTAAQTTQSAGLTAFNSNGFNISSLGKLNTSTSTYASWTFRKAPKFFDVVTYTGDGAAGKTINHSLNVAPGMMIVKRTDNTSSWIVYHRNIANTSWLALEQTAATIGPSANGWNNTSPTATQFTVGVNLNQNAGTYVAYLFAHDTAVDGIVQCGSFTTDGSSNATVNLGWEPQFLLLKRTDFTQDWLLFDVMRGWTYNASSYDALLKPNLSNAEALNPYYSNPPNPTGFTVSSLSASATYIYLAIRRPNKPPTVGTQVYNAIARTGTGAAVTVTGVGFAPDLLLTNLRTAAQRPFWDRLRGLSWIAANLTGAENTDPGVSLVGWDTMDGFKVGADTNTGYTNTSGASYINHAFKRAPGVFDEVCFPLVASGFNLRVSHSLAVAPEMIFVKGRSAGTSGQSWRVYNANLGRNYVPQLNETSAAVFITDYWGTSNPTISDFGMQAISYAAGDYVAYLFATKAGISKVGSYTGNGSSQTINAGFTTGARFILIKRTDSTGDWYVWDSVRGIVSANDPHLSLNTTAAEVTTNDSIDPDTSGFIVNQLAATNINVTSATYIYLAFA